MDERAAIVESLPINVGNDRKQILDAAAGGEGLDMVAFWLLREMVTFVTRLQQYRITDMSGQNSSITVINNLTTVTLKAEDSSWHHLCCDGPH